MSLIVIQMGHVPRTKGVTGARGEQAFTRAAGLASKTALEAAGHEVRLINADVPDAQYRGDAFIAIHADGSTNPASSGGSVGYRTPEGGQLASAWKRHYEAAGWNRGWLGDNYTANLSGYYGCKKAVAQGNKRACIVEAGFLTNDGDKALITAERMAQAIVGAVVELLGGVPVVEMPAHVPAVAVTPAPPPPPSIPPFLGTVRRGSRNLATREVQKRLKARGWAITVDGDFGPKTDAIVRAFQREKGLVVDGIVGPKTWAALWTAPIT